MKEISVKIHELKICSHCMGHGEFPYMPLSNTKETRWEICSVCKGTGINLKTIQ